MTTNFKTTPHPAAAQEQSKSQEQGQVTFAIKPGAYPVFNAIMPTKGGYILNFINGVYTTDDAEEIEYLRKEHVAAGNIIEQ